MADALGKAVTVGQERILAATVRNVAAKPVLITSGGTVLRADEAQTVLLSDLLPLANLPDAIRRSRVDGVSLHTFENALTGWSAYTAGTGQRYIQNPANVDALHSPDALTTAVCGQGAGTTGTNAACHALSNTHLFAGSGTRWLAHVTVRSLSRIAVLRVGYIGDNTAPTASGRPANGVWMEYDRSVDAADWSLVVADGGSYTTDTAGPAVAEDPEWSWFLFEMNSDTSVSVYEVTPGADPVEISTLSSGLPSTDARRSGRLFYQLIAEDPASGGFALFGCDTLVQIPTGSRTPVLA